MIAPFIETLFVRAFYEISTAYTVYKSEVKRWSRSQDDAERWNCRVYYRGQQERSDNLVGGIMQLSAAVGLALPTDCKATLEALFEYRNKMLHCGFEWPFEDRNKFYQRIKDANWPERWFSKASSDYKPWVFYMTHEFLSIVELNQLQKQFR